MILALGIIGIVSGLLSIFLGRRRRPNLSTLHTRYIDTEGNVFEIRS